MGGRIHSNPAEAYVPCGTSTVKLFEFFSCTQKKVISKEEENALSKFLSQFPLNLREFL